MFSVHYNKFNNKLPITSFDAELKTAHNVLIYDQSTYMLCKFVRIAPEGPASFLKNLNQFI